VLAEGAVDLNSSRQSTEAKRILEIRELATKCLLTQQVSGLKNFFAAAKAPEMAGLQ
jgi:hypothetical protein